MENKSGKTLSTISLVLGIVSVVLSGIAFVCILACGSLGCALANAAGSNPNIESDVQDFFNSLQ